MIYFSFLSILFLFIVSLIILIILILLYPAHILIYYNSSLLIKVKILFFHITIFPFPFGTIKKITNFRYKNAKSNNKKSKKEKFNLSEKNSLKTNDLNILEKIGVLKKILHISFLHSKKILKKIRFKINYLNIGIKGANAADIATNYGKYTAIISSLISLLENTLCLKKGNINIYPDFLEVDEPLKLDIDISASLIFIIYEAMIFAKSYAKIVNRNS